MRGKNEHHRGSLLIWALLFVISVAAGPAPVQPASDPSLDLSNLEAAITNFTNAAAKNDAQTMANFYYVDGAHDQSLALANARRILAATALQGAIEKHLNETTTEIVDGFRLMVKDLDYPAMYNIEQRGAVAVLSTRRPFEEEPTEEWFKKINGIWRQDISPVPPLTVAEVTQDMEQDNAAVRHVVDDVNGGKITTLAHVRDALGNAMLNSIMVPIFARDMRLMSEYRGHGSHERPDPHGIFPLTPDTPAGAMNLFVKAIQKQDETAIRECLYMPNDQHDEYHAAAAHDVIIGFHLLLAAESKFHETEDSDRICYWLDGVPRGLLRDYTDDEWDISRDYPELAISSGAEIRKTVLVDGKPATVFEMSSPPVMHRCPDGHWRIAPRFPKNARQLARKAARYTEKDKILEKAIDDLKSGYFWSQMTFINSVKSDLDKLGGSCTIVYVPD